MSGADSLPPVTGADLAARFDLRTLDQAFLDNPYPTYHALREHQPIHVADDGSVFLTRYADVAQVYRDRTMSSDKREMFRPSLGDGPIYEHHTTSLVFNDPPYHTRVRRAIQGAMISRVLATLRSGLETLVDDLLEAAASGPSFDLVTDFAAAIPVEVIGNLLAIPRAERGPLRQWSLSILGALEPNISDAIRDEGDRAVRAFYDYLDGLIAVRRKHLRLDGSDALSLLIAADTDGHRLTNDELIHNAIFLLNAGHETTTNLIANGVAALLENPGEHERLREQPQLLPSAVEEFLRYESSNQLGNRLVREQTVVGGVVLTPGTSITLGIGAANRDPDAFVDPDRLDISRDPNRHLAFGLGAHACAGMSLARMEGRIAIGRIVARFPQLRALPGAVRGGRARFRGYLRYPVSVE
ncbi:MAG: cytochrome P450 [Gammaproteobacteria bacterium]|nr:cytochrome P450 [Gammaproteobacteria bacterium]